MLAHSRREVREVFSENGKQEPIGLRQGDGVLLYVTEMPCASNIARISDFER